MGQLPSGAFDGSGTAVFPSGPEIRVVECVYDFAKHGGAQGSITIGKVPNGSIIMHGWVLIDTAITSGGAATAGLSSEAAGDIKATATLISAAPWTGAAGTKAGVVPAINTVTSYVVTTADRNIDFVIGVADLTAGKYRLFLLVQGA